MYNQSGDLFTTAASTDLESAAAPPNIPPGTAWGRWLGWVLVVPRGLSWFLKCFQNKRKAEASFIPNNAAGSGENINLPQYA